MTSTYSTLAEAPVLDVPSLETLIQQAFFRKDRNSQLAFLNRTPIVLAAVEDEIPPPVPKVKLGTRVGNGIVRRILEDRDEELLYNWRTLIVDRITSGLHQRMNVMLCTDAFESVIDDLHLTHVWSDLQGTPITDIRTFVKYAKTMFGVNFDRMTLSSTILKQAFLSTEFIESRKQYAQLFDVELTGEFEQDLTIFSQLVKLIVEVYDATYHELQANGETKEIRVLPENKIIFSSTANDNNLEAIDFAIGKINESNDSVQGQAYRGTEKYSPVGYVSINKRSTEELQKELEQLSRMGEMLSEVEIEAEREFIQNTEQVVVWGVVRGNIRRHEPTYTGCFTIV